jgi:prephenate dehydrogenase
MFNKISIIGCGLIGSSILRAARKKKASKLIYVYDKSKDVVSFLKDKKLCENATNDITSAVKDAELVIIASPLGSYKEIFLLIKDHLKKGTIITDTGSVKKEVNKIVKGFNLTNVSWIPSHPIAGTEESGPGSGFAELFEKRWCIISPEENAKKDDIEKVKKFWELIGSKTKIMSLVEHDNILSLTSHLPHAIAYNIVRSVVKNGDNLKDEIIKYSAGGLRDFTRIASSNPITWRDVFIDNSENILKALDSFTDNLEEMKKAIREKNSDKLIQIFSSTQEIRKEVIKAGQDTDKPDFGRKKS